MIKNNVYYTFMNKKLWWVVGLLILGTLMFFWGRYKVSFIKPTPDISTPASIGPVVERVEPCEYTQAGCDDPTRPEVTKD